MPQRPPYRVVQHSTGHVGNLALRALVEHPLFELVGLWVHSPDKVGRDAGELCGLPDTGVRATDDLDALLALEPDAVCYAATADLRPDEAADEICRILSAGVDVVSTSIVPLVRPASADTAMVARLEAACREGSSSFFTSGIDPGFANDLLPITLCGVCQHVDTVRVQEVLNYETYDQAEVLFGTMGFGQPLDAEPLLLLPGVLSHAWGGVVRLIADGLGVEVDELREVHERATLDHDVTISTGTVAAGTQAGLRFEVQGIVAGEPRIVVEHVTRIHDAVAPWWPEQGEGQGYYRVLIEGRPDVDCRLELDQDGDHNTGGLVATAMRVLHAVPAVVAAPPGLLTPFDLPLLGGRGNLG